MEEKGHDLALVIADLASGGAQRVLATLANEWSRRGRRICVITLSGIEEDFFALDARVNRISLSRIGPSQSWVFAMRANIQRVISLRRAILCTNAPVVLSFVGVTNILTVLACVGLSVHVVISERNDPTKQTLGWPWNFLRKLIYPRADLVSANSAGAVEALGKFVPARKLVLVPNPLAEWVEKDTIGTAEKSSTILTVGRLTHQKAHDILLRAFAVTAGSGAWRLEIVGTGELEDELRSLAEELGVADRVDWIGRSDNPYHYYGRARIFALPSRYEGTPNALLEAMSIGLVPVVSDASSGPLELVEDGVSGLVVPVGDIDALAGALGRLIVDENLCRRLGTAASWRLGAHEVRAVLAKWDDILGLMT